MPGTPGRPKTAGGHYDDLMLEILEFRGALGQHLKLVQAHYREERDSLAAMDEHLQRGAMSLTYSRIVDQMAAEKAAAS